MKIRDIVDTCYEQFSPEKLDYSSKEDCVKTVQSHMDKCDLKDVKVFVTILVKSFIAGQVGRGRLK